MSTIIRYASLVDTRYVTKTKLQIVKLFFLNQILHFIIGKHDKELLMGMNRHGLSRCEIHILNDKEFSFLDCLTKANKVPPRIVIKGEVKAETKTENDEQAKKSSSDEEKSKSPVPSAEEQKIEKSPQPAKSPEQVTVNSTTETTEKTNTESEPMETDKPEPKEDENRSPKPVENGDIKKDDVEPMETENGEATNKSEEPIVEKPKTQGQETEEGKTPSPKAPEETSNDTDKAKTLSPKSPEDTTSKKEGGRTSSSPEPVKKESEEPSEEASPKTPVIEVANEEEKALLEAELIKQQQLNKWPKDKFLMQRAEHVCFCITQGKFNVVLFIVPESRDLPNRLPLKE